VKRRTALLGVFLLSALTMALYRLPYWIVEAFGDISLEQAWFHLTLDGGQTLATVPTALLRGTARELLLKPLAWGLAVAVVTGLLWRAWPRGRHAVNGLVLLSALALGGLGLARAAQALNLQDHWTLPADAPDWMERDHVAPDVVALARSVTEQPRNLVLIYVESLQNKFVRPDRPLAKWREQHTSATRFATLPGTQWTLGGMVASQCGLPLMPTGWRGHNNFDETQAPLRGATCLGDVLRAAGFETAFVGGADPTFAGKQYFLHEHGFNHVYGRDDIRTQMNGYQWPEGWWGAEDHTLLAFATHVLDDLERSRKPFFLSLLTLDTHGPNGIPSRHCPDPGNERRMHHVFDCSLSAVEGFLAELERRGRLADTVVVLMGDHPLMAPGWSSRRPAVGNDAADDVFFAMAVPGRAPRQLDAISHFDVLPLSLQALQTPPGKPLALALGRTPPELPSLVASEGRDQLAARLRAPSPGYQKLWLAPAAAP
jgi:phosphoglycerol transferase